MKHTYIVQIRYKDICTNVPEVFECHSLMMAEVIAKGARKSPFVDTIEVYVKKERREFYGAY